MHPAFHQKPNCVYFISEVPNAAFFTKITALSLSHTHGLGIQPGLQIFKLEEILFQRTNIYGEGIQVRFPHSDYQKEQQCRIVSVKAGLTLTNLNVDYIALMILLNTRCVCDRDGGRESVIRGRLKQRQKSWVINTSINVTEKHFNDIKVLCRAATNGYFHYHQLFCWLLSWLILWSIKHKKTGKHSHHNTLFQM